jgi:DNA-binding response OmpR family regulator
MREVEMSVAEVFSQSAGGQRKSRVLPAALVIESDRELRIRLTEQLTELGVVPAVARNGYEGVRLAGAMRPGLIVIDGLLPEMHGFEVARFIRALDANYRPHIAMITAITRHTRYHHEAKLKYGIDDYVMKPVSDTAIAAIVSKLAKETK